MSEVSWFSMSTLKMVIYICGLGKVFLTDAEYDVFGHVFRHRAIYKEKYRELNTVSL